MDTATMDTATMDTAGETSRASGPVQAALPETQTLRFAPEPVLPHWMLTGGYGPEDEVTALNYDILGLQKRRRMNKGEVVSTEYWMDHDLALDEYSGLCVRETNHYLRQNDLVYCRFKKIEWMLSDGTVGSEKVTKKTYELREGIAEGVTRRKNVYEDAKLTAIGLLGIAPATDLLSAFGPYLGLYWEGNKHGLLKTLRDLQRPYLEEGHRQALLSILLIEDSMAQWGL